MTRCSSGVWPKATFAARLSFNITTFWLTSANCLRRESKSQCARGVPSSETLPSVTLTNRSRTLASVDLPEPEVPTRATVSPGLIVSAIWCNAHGMSGWYLTETSSNTIWPFALANWKLPPVSKGVFSISSKPRSSAASPRVRGPVISDRCLIGAININIAVTNAAKPPTVIAVW